MNDTPTPRTDEFEALRDAMSTRASADYVSALQLCDELERELTAVTEQRDRLAEILENSLSSFKITQVPKDYPANHWSNKAILELQSLKPSNDL
jgi:hypothetical protein